METIEKNMENCFFETLERGRNNKLTDADMSFLKCAKVVLENIIYSSEKYKTLDDYRDKCRIHLKEIKKYL